jgi:alpha-D-ribose 1-methylphosphonate 5-triphosphate synthase subunit PhnG
MFHAFDNPGPNRATTRAEWMALLARAPLPLLEQSLHPYQGGRRTEWLRRPETGLYMVQGRAGGSGERFNLGEVTVTRCALRSLASELPPSPVGVAYVLGRTHRQAELAALADALLQQDEHLEALEQELLEPVRRHLALQQARRQAQVQSTKVDFFTVAREAGGGDDEEDAQ